SSAWARSNTSTARKGSMAATRRASRISAPGRGAEPATPRRSRPPEATARLQDLPEHRGPVAQHPDLAARAVRPVDGHLGDPVAVAARAQEKLHVEAEPGRLERGEERLGAGRAEGLESALGVGDLAEPGAAHDGVEHPPRPPAMAPRPDTDRGIGERARPDDHVRAVGEGGLEPLELADRRGAVGVGEQPEVAVRGEHPGPHRRALAAVGRQPQQADPGRPSRGLADDRRRPAGATARLNTLGMMYSGPSSLRLTEAASAWAAASFISSLTVRARESSRPRKKPGKQSTLLIWFG